MKHIPKLDNKSIAQVMGYYAKSKTCGDNSFKIGIIVRKQKVITSISPLYSFSSMAIPVWLRMQFLMLPVYKCTYEEFLAREIVEIMFLMCMNAKHPLLELECLKEVTLRSAKTIIGVYDPGEFERIKLNEQLEEANKDLEEANKSKAEWTQKMCNSCVSGK